MFEKRKYEGYSGKILITSEVAVCGFDLAVCGVYLFFLIYLYNEG